MTIDIIPLKPDLFAIRFHRKRWLKTFPHKSGRERTHGWRSIVWTEDFAEAEKFGSQRDAEGFATLHLPGFRQNSQLTSTAATA